MILEDFLCETGCSIEELWEFSLLHEKLFLKLVEREKKLKALDCSSGLYEKRNRYKALLEMRSILKGEIASFEPNNLNLLVILINQGQEKISPIEEINAQFFVQLDQINEEVLMGLISRLSKISSKKVQKMVDLLKEALIKRRKMFVVPIFGTVNLRQLMSLETRKRTVPKKKRYYADGHESISLLETEAQNEVALINLVNVKEKATNGRGTVEMGANMLYSQHRQGRIS